MSKNLAQQVFALKDKPCYEEAKERRKQTIPIAEVEARMKMPYEEKLEYSRELTEKALKAHGDKIYVACSFGKDSMTVLHLARKVDPDVLVVFANTLNEYPQTYRMRDRIVDEWDLNYVETRPETTFFQCVKKFGVPQIRMRHKEPACCYHLKNKPSRLKLYELELEAMITGLTASESYLRKWMFSWHGDHFKTDKYYRFHVWKYHTIAFWTESDVWRYIAENEIPVNPAYSENKVDRVGCKFCTAHIGWEERIRRLYPRVYYWLKERIGNEKREAHNFASLDEFEEEIEESPL